MQSVLPKVAILENFLSQTDHDALLTFVLASRGSFSAAPVYERGRPSVRATQRDGLKLGGRDLPVMAPLIDRLKEEQETLFRGAGMKPAPVVRFETELAAYNDGGFFHEHIDTLTGGIKDEQGVEQARALSAVYYFYRRPRAFTGGRLRMWGYSDGEDRPHFDITPSDNALVAFPSFAMHEVLPVSCPSRNFEDSRFAVNCWLHCAI
jgi:SM-20-related protein